MTIKSELSYDGFGINGPDKYRTRIASFSRNEEYRAEREKYGPMFAASPDLLAALLDFVTMTENGNVVPGNSANATTMGQWRSTIREARAAISKAKGA